MNEELKWLINAHELIFNKYDWAIVLNHYY